MIIKYGDVDTYHYELNLQGDVIAILDSDGIRVVEYTYDAWGNILSITGSKKDTLGQANPLRYRGYVYDDETGMYYCQSRYYDPEIGRWLNADGLVATGQGFTGNNMFAYCLNNPVNCIDETGMAALWYYLFADSDYGFVHRMVQLHIKLYSEMTLCNEVTLGGHGRADIVDVNTGAVWEVKHAANDPAGRAILASSQARKYIKGVHDDILITHLGKAGAFTGSFIIKCDRYHYEVNYWTPQDGAILYSVTEIKDNSGNVFAEFIPSTSTVSKKDKKTVPVAAYVALGFAMCGGCSGLGLEKICCDMAYAY